MDRIERARRYLGKCPASVSNAGGHNAAYHAAGVLVHGFDLGDGDALALLREWNRSCQPPWSESELLHKVRSVAGVPPSKPRGYLAGDEGGNRGEPATGAVTGGAVAAPPKPAFCPMVLRRVAAKVPGAVDVMAFLRDRSPVDVAGQDSAAVLRLLYPRASREMVLVFSLMKSQGQLLWDSNASDSIANQRLPTGPEGVWFLPQPVDGVFHPNPRLGGKMSRRSEEAVTSWRYLVIESDEADRDEWLRCLIQMPLRIACICDSGGRSIHALVRLDAASKADWDAKVGVIKPVLVTLGADRGALSAVRLTRMPQAQRGKRTQRLLYLNPAPGVRAILDLPGRGKGADGRPAN